ncbi:MAG: type II secretion system protein GspJ [Alphaproteobacteria bacterium]|nr:type II secretion system protein GspJ [Alphaproteobacteria bacterium]
MALAYAGGGDGGCEHAPRDGDRGGWRGGRADRTGGRILCCGDVGSGAMKSSVHRESGFTLVEALVSLFVFSLIAVGCTVLLMQGVESQRRVAAAQASLRELQTARSLMTNDLLQLAPRRVRQFEGGHTPAFAGAETEGVAFVRAAAEPSAQGPRTRLAYVMYVIDGDRVVRRSRTILDEAQPQAAAMAERVMFANAVEARFEFFDGVAWRPQWQAINAAGAPRAVALTLRTPRYGVIRIEAATGTGT